MWIILILKKEHLAEINRTNTLIRRWCVQIIRTEDVNRFLEIPDSVKINLAGYEMIRRSSLFCPE